MPDQPEAVILAARRTPIGKYLGAFAELSADELGCQLAVDLMRTAHVRPDQVDQVIVGCALQAGLGMNVARQVAVRAGIPVERPSFTVNQVCGSGLQAVQQAAQQVWLGQSRVVLAGGVERMSGAPFLTPRDREGAPNLTASPVDSMQSDGLMDCFEHIHMGCTAERIVSDLGISRAEQDAYALESQRRYQAVRHRLAEEITPISGAGADGPIEISRDEHPRETSLAALAGLRPVFQDGGTVTAGNASGINDGAALAVVASGRWADDQRLRYDHVLRGFNTVGIEPGLMGLGPVEAIRGLLERHRLQDEDVDLYEINEAFAGQVLGVLRQLDLDTSRVNVNGGAIALGHPIGASGCRILVTLTHEMRRRNARRGVAALCVGGGMGIAALVEAAELEAGKGQI
ncbi:MAG: thiolase family protein [Chloroflexota bacterium]|nr:thiolase family protein [Chloroflexota bacterium]